MSLRRRYLVILSMRSGASIEPQTALHFFYGPIQTPAIHAARPNPSLPGVHSMIFPVATPWCRLQKSNLDGFQKLRVSSVGIKSLPVNLTPSRQPNRTNSSSQSRCAEFEPGNAPPLVFPGIREANDRAAIRQTELSSPKFASTISPPTTPATDSLQFFHALW